MNLYKKQHEMIEGKSNDKKALEKQFLIKHRITELEENIQKIRAENEDLNKKIKLLKNKQSFQSRELEVYNRDKEYPTKVNN